MSDWPHDLNEPIPMEHPDAVNLDRLREHLDRAVQRQVDRYLAPLDHPDGDYPAHAS